MRSEPTMRVRTTRTRWLVGAVAAVVVAASAVAPAFATSGTNERADNASPSEKSAPKAAQTLRWTADNRTGTYKDAPETAEAGPATLVFENSEATGNTSGMQHTLTFDKQTDGYNHDVDVDIIATPTDENNGKWQVDVELTEGTYRYHCTIPGHGQMQGELVVTGGGGDPGDDTTPPKTNAKIEGRKNGNGAFVGQAKVTVTANDEGGSGVDTIEYRVDDTGWKKYTDPVTVSKVGDHTLAYRATDKAGNTSKPVTEEFKVVKDDGKDVTPPKAPIKLSGKTNADGAYVGTATVAVNASDDQSGVDKVQYRLDDGKWQAYSNPLKVKKVGKHTVRARATDKAGNTSKVTQKAFEVVPGAGDDTEPPNVSATVAGTQDSDWNYTGPITLKVQANDAGSGVDKVQYRLDGGDWQAYEEPVEVEDEGEHEAAYRARDAVGNTSEVGRVSFTIVSDSSGPKCADPDPSPTVVMGAANSGVRNREADGTCTIDDLIRDEARWATHQAFVKHATNVTADLLEEGIVTNAERTKIVNAAKRSDVGKGGMRRANRHGTHSTGHAH